MLPYPENYMISSGKASGAQQLVAFDAALIDAGISNYNLLRVSSILPVGCVRKAAVEKKEGSALLTAYGSVSTNVKGETIASAVAVGIPCDAGRVGVIMEYADRCDAETAEKTVREIVLSAMENHGIPCKEVQSSAIEATASGDGWISVISSIAMW
jgi:arginine decarboxylase